MKKLSIMKLGAMITSLVCSSVAVASNKSGLADTPLFLGQNTKHNLLLAIDDSGSMDWELLMKPLDGVTTANGVLYANNTMRMKVTQWGPSFEYEHTGYVTGDSGFMNDAGTGYLKGVTYSDFYQDDGNWYFDEIGSGYTYLFNPGNAQPYDGRNVYGSSIVPPVDAYGFARSSDYNLAYYSPHETYVPWTDYKDTSFDDIDPENAPYDASVGSNVINLTQTETQTFRLFENMVMDNNGAKSSDYVVDIPLTFYPAMYYYRTYDGSYNYLGTEDASVVSGPAEPHVIEADTETFHQGNSLIMEAEDGVATLTPNSWIVVDNDDSASNGHYITTTAGGSTTDTPIANRKGKKTELKNYIFRTPGTVNIWFRIKISGLSGDSFFVSLGGAVGHSDFPGTDASDWKYVANKNWYRMESKTDVVGEWVWVKWGEGFDTNGDDHHLRIRQEENNVDIDQILITSENSAPEGLIVLGPEPAKPGNRSCDIGAIKAEHYKQYINNPELFEDVDAIAPDGACLIKYEIKDGNVFPSGRSYTDEMQNFANWFTYYRKRHQATRGAIASSLSTVSGFYTGVFGINDLSSPTMYDWDDVDERKGFLDASYSAVGSGGTPLRAALNYAGEQFMRTTSPIVTAKCQRNFTLLFTDGYNNGNNTVVGNLDSSLGAPYSDTYENTLADIALKYYNTNLAPSLPEGKVKVPTECSNDTPPADADCNNNLHMNTYTAALNGTGTIFNQVVKIGDEDVRLNLVEQLYEYNPTWPDVNSKWNGEQIDDLYHAALNGRGEIFNAKKPSALASTLAAAIQDILSDVGQGSGITFNTATLKEESLAFTAEFDSSKWSGKLFAQEVNVNTGDIEKGKVFDAGQVLDSTLPSSRIILTYNDVDKEGVAFQWDNLTPAQQADLSMAPSKLPDLNGEKRLNFLRGSRSDENGLFRARTSVLGDIIHSSPVFVGEPSLTWPNRPPFGDPGDIDNDSNYYGDFKERVKNRTPVIYAGANDGMLHGFKATQSAGENGKELLAFVPNSVYSAGEKQGLHFLTDPAYEHRYYVDLKPVVSDVYLKTHKDQVAPEWATVLIGGLRGGGRGLFALDVTDPTKFTEANAEKIVMWEFTDEDDADLGDITSPPKIGMMENGRWAAIFGNGYNAEGDGKAKLFILYLDGGLDGIWTYGTDYLKIDTGSAGGLSAVALADATNIDPDSTGGDRIIDRIYAGDDQGNMWAFDVHSETQSNWDVAMSARGSKVPLFSVPGSPITAAPVLGANPNPNPVSESATPDIFVYFGTGKYLVSGDLSNVDTQYFVGVLDVGVGEKTFSDLEARTIVNRNGLRSIHGSQIDWSTDFGFYMPLPDAKERVVVTPQIRGKTVWFDTVIPTTTPCDNGGTGWIMAVDYASGLAPSTAAFDANDDSKVNDGDTIIVDEYGNIITDQTILDLFDNTKNRIDSDNDGLADVYEILMFGSIDAYDARLDSDNDDIPDYWEIYFGLNPNRRNNQNADFDGDGISDYEEFLAKTDPTGNKVNPWYGYRREGYVGKIVETGMPTESSFLGDNLYTPTSSGSVERDSVESVKQGRVGRFAWTELVNDGT